MAFPDGTADFRSDTVTRPTEAMRRAMAAADVGDDVYSEDPTVAALEEEAARLVGKEAAVYTPSGTMGNQLAINLLAAPGTELVAVDDAHVRDYERAAASMISGVAFRTVAGRGGVISAEALGDLMVAAGTIRPRISVLVWENTHNASGGRVVPLEVMAATTEIARQPRPGGPPRRRPVVQRGGGLGRACRPICRPRRHRPVLFLQRAGRPGGLDPLR